MKNKKLRTPLLFKEGLGWLITEGCAVFFCAVSFYATTDSTGITYTATTANTSTSTNSIDGISCGGGFNEVIKQRDPEPMAVVNTTDFDSSDCSQLQWSTHLLAQGSDFQKMYDSAKYTIEHCAIYDVSPHIWADFGEATNGLQDLNKDPNRWSQYREWLKKVLYLNVDTNYYCSDVNAILSTMQFFNEERGLDRNGSLAIIKFLRDSNRCISWYFMSPQVWTQTRQDQYDTWRDTAKNPKLNPLDTTLPSLEDLDLQVLRGPQYTAVKDAFIPTSTTKIMYLNVSENPFKDETTLRFGMADDEYMRVDIYDLLGNKVYSDTKLFGQGDKEWRIDGKSLARGALYARLSTMGGEVKTVKLVHDK